MALYEYCAIHSKTGKRISEKTEIADLTLFLREMHRQGYIVTSVKKAGSFWRRLSFLRPKRAISKSDKGMAMLELSAFLKAGIPLKQSLEQMAQESPQAVSQVLLAAALDLEQGVSFHKAISARNVLMNGRYRLLRLLKYRDVWQNPWSTLVARL